MLELTTIGGQSHVASQALGEVRYRLVDVFLWQLFPDGLQGDFQLNQSSPVSGGACGTFPACPPDVIT